MFKLNLGCGNHRIDGYINIDKEITPAIDLRLDLDDIENDWTFIIQMNSVDEIYANHTIEHLKDLIKFFNDVWFVCKEKALVRLFFPKAGTEADFADPTHKQHICLKTIQNFCEPNENMKNYGFWGKFNLLEHKEQNDEIYCLLEVVK